MKKKQETVTFKVDRDLMEIIKEIPNRSEFIRRAVLSATGTICPLCNGSGMLTPNQKKHWDDFSVNHVMTRCQECDERVLICKRK
jgi:hypothetical protein